MDSENLAGRASRGSNYDCSDDVNLRRFLPSTFSLVTFSEASEMAKIRTTPIHPAEQPSSPPSAEVEAPPTGGRTLDHAVVSPAELAAYLRVDIRVVYQMIGRREIPGVRQVGRQFRIDRTAVLKWLADGQGRVSRSSTRSLSDER